MALDTVRGIVALASGLTETTKAKATQQAMALLNDERLVPLVSGGMRAQAQVQALADEIVATSRANRELIVGLIRTEVERALAAVGTAGRDEISVLQASIDRLERRVAVLESREAAAVAAQRSAASATAGAAQRPARKSAAAKKTSSTTTARKRAAATKTTAAPAAARGAGKRTAAPSAGTDA